MYWFTADEHYGHVNIIEHCQRPFMNVKEMDQYLIDTHNEVVEKRDTVVHVGDFCWKDINYAMPIIKALNGNHIFVCGSHDRWLKKVKDRYGYVYIRHLTIEKQVVIACHYAMRVWPQSHHGSWQVYGHSHGCLEPVGNQYDVGVDNNYFYPVSFEELSSIIRRNNETIGQD